MDNIHPKMSSQSERLREFVGNSILIFSLLYSRGVSRLLVAVGPCLSSRRGLHCCYMSDLVTESERRHSFLVSTVLALHTACLHTPQPSAVVRRCCQHSIHKCLISVLIAGRRLIRGFTFQITNYYQHSQLLTTVLNRKESTLQFYNSAVSIWPSCHL